MTELRPHPDYERMKKLMPEIVEFQKLASEHGIGDVFQDNGGKLLQLVLTMDLVVSRSRRGSDARDRLGRHYELKSLNIDLQQNFTTSHHLNARTLDRYRKMGWLFALYRGIELVAIYSMEAYQLEGYFSKWTRDIEKTGQDLNNPKIPLKFVIENGTLIHGEPPTAKDRGGPPLKKPPIDPFEADN